MADKETKSTMREFTTNDQANYYLGIISIMVNGKNAYELKEKFLDDLHKNAFSGTNGKDAVEHIKYFLRIVDPIDLPNVNQDKLRVVVFPISLSDEDKTDEIFNIETDIFDYESPLCMALNEFNYLLKVDSELLTYDIERTGNYDDYMNQFNDEFKEPWDEDGIPYEIGDHICKHFCFKNERTKWPTCSSTEDGFCNGGELPRMVRVDNFLNVREIENYERCEVFGDHERPACNIRRFETITYSFRDDEEYMAIKENDYDDLTNTRKKAIHAY
nr:hypothetical protein [Tanacetum cinerariifolium]